MIIHSIIAVISLITIKLNPNCLSDHLNILSLSTLYSFTIFHRLIDLLRSCIFITIVSISACFTVSNKRCLYHIVQQCFRKEALKIWERFCCKILSLSTMLKVGEKAKSDMYFYLSKPCFLARNRKTLMAK